LNRLTLSLVLVLGGVWVVTAQKASSWKLPEQLQHVFPQATSFSPREGNPPHFKAFTDDPKTGMKMPAGFVYWTTELEPLERGYDGPIKMLVGMDMKGRLTNVLVVDHHEPYGNFSVEPPEFGAQFQGKSIRDAFRVGADVDAVSRATITVSSAARAIRNSSRRMARQFLTPEGLK
jgi:transcriptional regulator of nitric oxide reductase